MFLNLKMFDFFKNNEFKKRDKELKTRKIQQVKPEEKKKSAKAFDIFPKRVYSSRSTPGAGGALKNIETFSKNGRERLEFPDTYPS